MGGSLAVRIGVPASLREGGPFRLLFWGQALSVVGDRLGPIAIAFATLAIGTTTDVGLVFAAGGVPFALFGIVGGVISDRIGRRRVMIASDVLRTCSQGLMAALLLSDRAEVWMIIALSFVYGSAAAVFMPALMGLIPQTVRAARLQEANALLALSRSVGTIIGPVIAGVLIAAAGPGEAIAFDAGTFALSAICLSWMRLDALHAVAGVAESFVAQLRDGWNEVRSRVWLRYGLVAMAAYHVLVLPSVFVLGPSLAERELSGATSWATIVTCFGIGSVVGNLVALRLPVRRPARVSALGLVGASLQAAIIGSGMGTAGIAIAELFAGICVGLFFTLWDLNIQEQVPPQKVSRVSSYDFSVSLGLMPIGMAISGPVSAALGLQATLLGMSALGLMFSLLWLTRPEVSQLRRPARDVVSADEPPLMTALPPDRMQTVV